MSLARTNYNPRLLLALTARGAFRDAPVSLLDVGCSGGIEAFWRGIPSDQFRAIAVDPMVDEIDRLRGLETNANVEYVPAWIKCKSYPEPEGVSNRLFRPTSAMAYAATAVSSPRQPRLADKTVSADELVTYSIDFMKVDTDGGDMEVLVSAEGTLASVLGVAIEVQFQGFQGDYDNTFSSIDRFLRRHGFSLYDLDVHRYSSDALPDNFVYIIPAQTNRGQIILGEAVYLRHPALMDSSAALKLAAFFEIFGLNDCAVAVIQANPGVFEEGDLDILADEWHAGETYASLMQRFKTDPRSFLAPPPVGFVDDLPDWIQR